MSIDLTGLVRPHLVEVMKRDDNPNVAEFRLQPLERGFGYTLGNSLRRLLLSSLRGSAVWGFRLDGVVHEHQTVQGVLQDDRDVNMELYVNKGRGYVESELHPADRSLPIDLVRIDAIYNPVRRANFTVAETRVGQRTDYDRLTVSIETNGTITPEDAIAYAAALAQTHFQYFVDFGRVPTFRDQTDTSDVGGGNLRARLSRLIDDLQPPLSVRSLNSLKNSNIRTLKDLVEFSAEDLLKVKNVGEKALQEIADLLKREELNFGMGFEEADGDLRIARPGQPPAVPAVVMNGENA